MTPGLGGSGVGGAGANGSANGAGVFLDAVNLNINSTGFNTISDQISGTGGLNFNGPGHLNITSNNNYSGLTTINGGLLSVNGSLASSVLVNPGAALGGDGSVGATTVNGIIAPGNSIGNLHILGNYVQNPGSSYQVQLNPAGQSDRISVSGSAQINGGTILVQPAPGAYFAGEKFIILTASNGVSGHFAQVLGTIGNFKFVDQYFSNQIDLVAQFNGLPLSGLTFNQTAVARVFNDPNLPTSLQPVLAQLQTLDPAALPHALDQLSGAIYGSILSASRLNALQTGQLLFDQLRSSLCRPYDFCSDPCGNPIPLDWNPWFRVRGGLGSINGDGNASGLAASSGGFLMGLDRWFSDQTRLGFYAGYNRTFLSVNDLSESANLDSFDLGISASHSIGRWYSLANLGYGFNHYQVNRQISFAGPANTGYMGNSLNAAFESGWRQQLGSLSLQPFTGLQYLNLHNNGATETGAGAVDLNVSSQTAQALWTSIGSRFSLERVRGNWVIAPNAQVAWLHDLLGDNRAAGLQFAGGGLPFMVLGARTGQDFIRAGSGMSFNYGDHWRLFFDYTLLASPQSTFNIGSGGIEFHW